MENLTAVLGTFIVLTPVCVGLVAVVKKMNIINETRYAPLVSVVIGLGLAALASTLVPALTWGAVVLGGLALGLSASGLYSGAKTIVGA